MILKELTITIQLIKDIKYPDLVEKLSYAINMYFLATPELMAFHKGNKIKKYCYSGLYPVSPSKVYLKGEMYSFKIRFIDSIIADEFKNSLINNQNPIFIVLGIDEQIKKRRRLIRELYTVTPSVITVANNKQWIANEKELDFAKERILKNTIRKFNELTGFTMGIYDFIDKIEIQNRKPVGFKYKGTTLLGNKFKIAIKEDEFSQQLAFLILGTGLLEKNALSFGFCTIAERME